MVTLFAQVHLLNVERAPSLCTGARFGQHGLARTGDALDEAPALREAPATVCMRWARRSAEEAGAERQRTHADV